MFNNTVYLTSNTTPRHVAEQIHMHNAHVEASYRAEQFRINAENRANHAAYQRVAGHQSGLSARHSAHTASENARVKLVFDQAEKVLRGLQEQIQTVHLAMKDKESTINHTMLQMRDATPLRHQMHLQEEILRSKEFRGQCVELAARVESAVSHVYFSLSSIESREQKLQETIMQIHDQNSQLTKQVSELKEQLELLKNRKADAAISREKEKQRLSDVIREIYEKSSVCSIRTEGE